MSLIFDMFRSRFLHGLGGLLGDHFGSRLLVLASIGIALTCLPAGAHTYTSNPAMCTAPCDFHTNSSWTSPTGTTFPGPADTAIIDSGHSVVAVLDNVVVSNLQVNNSGLLTLGPASPTLEIQAFSVVVDGTGMIVGGTATDLIIRGQNLGSLSVMNLGVIRGGSPSGSLFIYDSFEDVSCSGNSSVTSMGGSFLSGSGTAGGAILIISGDVNLNGATVQAGDGTVGGGGSVYIGAHRIVLENSSSVTSGSSPPGVTAGSVQVIAYTCQGNLGYLEVEPGSSILTGTPMVNGCPGVMVFSSGTSILGGTIGLPGVNCIFWDPPDLELTGPGKILGEEIIIVGDRLQATQLMAGALQASDTISITLSPGGVLDLEDLSSGTLYFEAGSGISLCADDIRLAPGVLLEDLMSPAPTVCPGAALLSLSLTPGTSHEVRHGQRLDLPLQVANVGNAGDNVTITVSDSAGWLTNGLSTTEFLAPGDFNLILAILQVPPTTAVSETILSLTADAPGLGRQTVTSVVTVVSIFADGFESGDVTAWSQVAP